MADKKAVQQTRPSRVRKKPPVRRKGDGIGNGKGKGRRSPQQLERQAKVFEYHVVEANTVRATAKQFSITTDTVISDVRYEAARRSDELAAKREHEKAVAVEFYSGIIRRALKRAKVSDDILDKILSDPFFDAKISDRSLQDALNARERIDKIIGLDAPTKVDLGLQQLIDALGGGDDRNRALE